LKPCKGNRKNDIIPGKYSENSEKYKYLPKMDENKVIWVKIKKIVKKLKILVKKFSNM
jgi:ribosomal protein L25 (general stress protein Ctc)